jgi:hypothetical protein
MNMNLADILFTSKSLKLEIDNYIKKFDDSPDKMYINSRYLCIEWNYILDKIFLRYHLLTNSYDPSLSATKTFLDNYTNMSFSHLSTGKNLNACSFSLETFIKDLEKQLN